MLAMKRGCMLCGSPEATPYISAVHQLVSLASISQYSRGNNLFFKRVCPKCLLNAPAVACIDAKSCSMYDLRLDDIAHLTS